ncbi:hypothetical protein Tco_1046255 [Tanacetum coccineum]
MRSKVNLRGLLVLGKRASIFMNISVSLALSKLTPSTRDSGPDMSFDTPTSPKYVSGLARASLEWDDLNELIIKYKIPRDLHPRLPFEEFVMSELPDDAIGVYHRIFDFLDPGRVCCNSKEDFPLCLVLRTDLPKLPRFVPTSKDARVSPTAAKESTVAPVYVPSELLSTDAPSSSATVFGPRKE